MQWADAAAWDLLEHVQSRLGNERILICLTVRDEPGRVLDTDRRVRLSRDERLRTLHLGPLSEPEIRSWMESVLDRRDLPPDLFRLVQMRAEGNPLLVNQFLRAMLDAHALWHDGVRWQWRLPADLPLPAGSYDLFARRIEHVAPLSRRMLAVAAVIGRRFDLDLLIAAGGWHEDDVLEAIDEGVEAGVIEAVESTDALQFSFCHGLMHDALRRAINPRRAKRVHERVAQALERRDPLAAAQLAEHYDRAGNDARAYEHAMRAGAAAADLHAQEDAIAFYLAAARHAHAPAQKTRAFAALVQTAERMGAYGRCERFCDQALEQLQSDVLPLDSLVLRVTRARVRFQTGATAAETLASCADLMNEVERLGHDESHVALFVLQSHAFARLGDFLAAERSAADAVVRAGASGDQSAHVVALNRLGSMILERDPDEALTIFRRAMEIAEDLGDAHAEVRCRINVGVACARSQRDDAANTAYETAWEMAQRLHAPDLAGLAALNLGVSRLHAGRFTDARDQLASAIGLFTLVKNDPHRLASLYNAASVEREFGNANGAAELYARARDLARQLGHRDVALGAAAGAGLAALRLGRLDDALAAANELRQELAAEGDRWFQGREMAEALMVRAALESRDDAGAAQQFRIAVARAEAHDHYGAAWLVAEVVTDLVSVGCTEAWSIADRLGADVARLGYASLAARYVVLRDLAQREPLTSMYTR
jgi:tetratricopeptide (TPR) repeat protein